MNEIYLRGLPPFEGLVRFFFWLAPLFFGCLYSSCMLRSFLPALLIYQNKKINLDSKLLATKTDLHICILLNKM